jgi:hypothetical protein
MAASPGPAPTRAATDPAPRSDTGASAGQHVLHLRRNPKALPRPRHLSLETSPSSSTSSGSNGATASSPLSDAARRQISPAPGRPHHAPPHARTQPTHRSKASPGNGQRSVRSTSARARSRRRPRRQRDPRRGAYGHDPWLCANRERRRQGRRGRRVTLVDRPAGRRVPRLVSRRCRPGGRIERRSGSRGHGRQVTTPIGGIATPSLSFCRWGPAGLSRWAVERGASPVTWRLGVTP